MNEQKWAVLDAANTVLNIIVADADFIKSQGINAVPFEGWCDLGETYDPKAKTFTQGPV